MATAARRAVPATRNSHPGSMSARDFAGARFTARTYRASRRRKRIFLGRCVPHAAQERSGYERPSNLVRPTPETVARTSPTTPAEGHMIGAAMSGVRWTYAIARVPSRVFHRLSSWAWWAFDDSGKPMPRKARRAAAGATLVLGVAAVGASAMHWLEPQRAAILWAWFTILAIAGSAFQASRQMSRRARTSKAAPSGSPGESRSLRERVRAAPRQAAAACSTAARKGYASFRRSAPGHAATAWAFTRRAGKATCDATCTATRRIAKSAMRAGSRAKPPIAPAAPNDAA